MEHFDEIDELILNGGLQFAGNNSRTGEPMYKATDELKNINPVDKIFPGCINISLDIFFSIELLYLYRDSRI